MSIYNLRNFSKKVVSVIVPSAEYSDAVSVIEKAVRSNGGIPVILISNSVKNLEAELIDFSVKYKKAGGSIQN